MSGGGLPGKLVGLPLERPETSELFIVEGDSPAAAPRAAATREFQAILPLKGKILNVEKARLDKMLSTTKSRRSSPPWAAASAPTSSTSASCRYGKIIIMSDADVDGQPHPHAAAHVPLPPDAAADREGPCVRGPARRSICWQKGKKSEYVLNDAVLHRKLTDLGIEDAVLHIRNASAERTVAGQDLRELYQLLEKMDAHARGLPPRC